MGQTHPATGAGRGASSADAAGSKTQCEVRTSLCGQGLVPDGFPVPGQEFVYAGVRQLGDAGEDIGEPGLRANGERAAELRALTARRAHVSARVRLCCRSSGSVATYSGEASRTSSDSASPSAPSPDSSVPSNRSGAALPRSSVLPSTADAADSSEGAPASAPSDASSAADVLSFSRSNSVLSARSSIASRRERGRAGWSPTERKITGSPGGAVFNS